jgi:hypothetical protein
MAWDELSRIEKLAYMQEAYDRLGKELKVNGDGIRGELDREFAEMYADPDKRTKSRDVIINGQKVGTYSLHVTEPTPEHATREFAVTDRDALESNDDVDFRMWVSKWVERNIDSLAEQYFEDTGEIVDGCDYKEVTHPAKAGKIGPTTLRIQHDKFGEAARVQLPDAISGFLMSSN